jgi:hypothetical protein
VYHGTDANNCNNHNDTFPVRKLGVYRDHLVNSCCPGWPGIGRLLSAERDSFSGHGKLWHALIDYIFTLKFLATEYLTNWGGGRI